MLSLIWSKPTTRCALCEEPVANHRLCHDCLSLLEAELHVALYCDGKHVDALLCGGGVKKAAEHFIAYRLKRGA